jgi:hypothetical protein
MKLGTNDIGSVYLGTNAVQKVYLGTNEVWSAGGGFDADYQAVLDYATTQGYTLPSASQQLLQNQLVVDLKDAGIWAKLDTFAAFATDGDSDFALIDWIRLTQNTAVNSPTFTANQGFQGNSTSAYIDLNYNPTIDAVNYSQDDASSMVYVKNIAGGTATKGYTIADSSLLFQATNSGVQRLNSSGNFGTSVNFSDVGMHLMNRVASTELYAFNGTTEYSSSISSLPLVNATIGVLQRSGAFYGGSTISFELNGSNLRDEQNDLNTALNTYMTSI